MQIMSQVDSFSATIFVNISSFFWRWLNFSYLNYFQWWHTEFDDKINSWFSKENFAQSAGGGKL